MADELETRERLLDVACELFAQKGYGGSSVSEITGQAKANKAAVSYHFGGKAELYQAAWRREFLEGIRKFPVDGGVSSDAPPEERLRGHILSFVRRISDPKNREFDIVAHEHVNPTGLLHDVMRKSIEPLRDHLKGIVSELLGAPATPEQVHLCCMSIGSQCRELCRRKRSGKSRCRLATEMDADMIAEHVFRFSLAGIKGVRTQPDRPEREAS